MDAVGHSMGLLHDGDELFPGGCRVEGAARSRVPRPGAARQRLGCGGEQRHVQRDRGRRRPPRGRHGCRSGRCRADVPARTERAIAGRHAAGRGRDQSQPRHRLADEGAPLAARARARRRRARARARPPPRHRVQRPVARHQHLLRGDRHELVVEFVPKEDAQVAAMLRSREDIFPGYTITGFRDAFAVDFRLVEEQQIADSRRVLFRMERRAP